MSRVIADGLSKKVLAKGLTFTGDIAAPKITASTGILFGTDTAASNTLDDYEEGDFTASLSNLGTGTIDLEKSTYTKIGRQVIVNVYMKIGSIGDASGSIQVAGLPFTSKSSSLSRSATSSVHGTNWSVATAGLNGLVLNGRDTITFYQNMATDTSNFSTDITDMGAGGSLAFTLSYITD